MVYYVYYYHLEVDIGSKILHQYFIQVHYKENFTQEIVNRERKLNMIFANLFKTNENLDADYFKALTFSLTSFPFSYRCKSV